MQLTRRLAALERRLGEASVCPVCFGRKRGLVVVFDDDPVPSPRPCAACCRSIEPAVVVRIE